MDEYNPYADLYADFAGDLLGAGVAIFPAMAGASPGFLDDMGAIADFVISNTLDPAYEALAGKAGGVIRDAWTAVESAFHRLTWWVYSLFYGAFHNFVNTPTLIRFSHPDVMKSLSSHLFLSETFRMLVELMNYIRDQGLNWIRDRVHDALGFVSSGFGNLWGAIQNWVSAVGNWIRDRVHDALGFVGSGFGNLWGAIQNWVSAIGNWIRDRVHDALGFVGSGFGNLWGAVRDWVSQVGNWIRDRVREALGFVGSGFGNLWGAIQSWVSDVGNWIRDRVRDALGFAGRGFTNMADFVERQLSDFGTWIYDNVGRPLLTKIGEVGLAVIGGAQDVVGFFVDALQNVLIGPVQEIIATAEAKLAIPGKLIHGEYATLDEFFNDIVDPAPVILGALVGPIIIALIISFTTSLAMSTLLTPLLQRPIQEMQQRAGDRLMTLDDIHESWNRDFLPESAAVELLGRTGYGGLSLEAVKKLRYRLPPLTDLTRMAVREVFNPVQRLELTLDADYPDALTAPAKALGLEEIWARNYWAAHWDLPSPTQGFEMLHRNVIQPPELTALLKALDYAPVWRQRLQDISYNPLTRVDIRRMYRAGILQPPQVKRAYLDLGYNETNAEFNTQFTLTNYAPADLTTTERNRELTASHIRTSYRRHIITRDDALTRLIEIGYDAEESDFQLDLDDAQLAQNPTGDSTAPVRDLTTGALMEAYRERVLTRAQVTTELTVLGYAGNEITVLLSLEDLQVGRARRNARAADVREKYISRTSDYAAALAELTGIGIHPDHGANLLAEWGADHRRGERKLTVADVFRALNSNVFTTDQALQYLRRLGYNDGDAGVLMRLRTGG